MSHIPSDKEIREYISGYYQQHEDCERFRIISISDSPETNAREVKTYAEWSTDGESTMHDNATWTVWYENVDGKQTVYGEH